MQVMPMVKMLPRGFTAAADAYLTPHIVRYLQTFCSGFDAGLSNVELSFMQSDGGLSAVDSFSGHKAILSGPAGGYVGYANTTRWAGMDTGKRTQVWLPLWAISARSTCHIVNDTVSFRMNLSFCMPFQMSRLCLICVP